MTDTNQDKAAPATTRIKLQQEWKRSVTVSLPHPTEVDEDLVISFVAVFKDLSPDELQSYQEQVADEIRPLFEMIRMLDKAGSKTKPDDQAKALADVQAAAEDLDEDTASDIVPLIERVFVRPERLEIETADGGLLDAAQTREYCLKEPRFRKAIQAKFDEVHQRGGAGLGNLLRSAGAGPVSGRKGKSPKRKGKKRKGSTG